MNSITISGRLGADPVKRATLTGKTVCSFSLAVRRPHKKDVSDWIEVVVYGQGAEFVCNYAKKGDLIGVVGILTRRDYTDREGNKRHSYEVVGSLVDLLSSSRKGESDSVHSEPVNAIDEFEEVIDDEELPF